MGNIMDDPAYLRALAKATAPKPPAIPDRNAVVIHDKLKGIDISLTSALRSIGQLRRRAGQDIMARFSIPRDYLFTAGNFKIVHRSQITKEARRASGARVRAQVEQQRQNLSDGQRQALLEDALEKRMAKRERKSDNEQLNRIFKIIKDTPTLDHVGPHGIAHLRADLGDDFKPSMAGKIINALLMKSKGAREKQRIKFIVKGQFSRRVDGLQDWTDRWISLNTKDSALELSYPYYQGVIDERLKALKPTFFQDSNHASDVDIEVTWQNIEIYATFEDEPEAGGANNNFKVVKLGLMKCKSYHSSNNNCLIACLLAATLKKVTRHDSIRQALDIPLNAPIKAISAEAGLLAEWFGVALTIVDEKGEALVTYNAGADVKATVCLMVDDKGLGHYVLVVDKEHVKKRCTNCNKHVFDLEKHECNANNISYTNEKVNPTDTRFYTTRGLTQKKRQAKPLTLAFFDFETYNEAVKAYKAVTYNAGLLIGDVYRSFWGKDSLSQFLGFVTTYPDPLLLISYNGSGFDNFFILNYLTEHHIPLAPKKEPIIAGSRILALELANGTKFWDLYNFTAPSSLDNLYNDTFGVKEGGKSFFPHQFIKKWEDIDYSGRPITEPALYTDFLASLAPEDPKLQRFNDFVASLPDHYSLREESDKYLRIDCEVLQKCFTKCHAQFLTDYGLDILGSLTLASAAEKYFRSTIPKDKRVELGTSRELYDLYKRANYGGRVQPHRQHFKSKDNGKPFEEVKDYLVDVDAVSLYPTVMQKFEYPVGPGRWLSKEEHAFAKHGVYNVDVVPNARLLVPAIPAKSDKGFTCWDLLPRKDQCYTLPDILSGIAHGYEFTIRKAYVFDESIQIFAEYISRVFTIKQEEDSFKLTKNPLYNPTRRMISKLLMNSLYGKMSQKPIEDKNVTIAGEADMRKFLREYDWRDLHEMGDKVVAVGKAKDFSLCVRKPMQLGSYILAYSRTLMTSFMDKLDPACLQITDRASLDESWANTYMYGDTDSMLIHSSTLPRLNGILYDPEVHKAKELGMLDDELEGGKIIELYAPAPKLYALKYITPDVQVHEKIRGKGVVSFKLKYEDFPRLCNAEQVEKSFFMMTKFKYGVPKTQRDQGFNSFTIEGRVKSRTLGKTQWGGRVKAGASGLTVPQGFDLSLLQ